MQSLVLVCIGHNLLFPLILGWSYRYYCPIPGCVHHILSCMKLNGENCNTTEVNIENEKETKASNISCDVKDEAPKKDLGTKINPKHFPHITALKQHYSKVNLVLIT